MRKALSGALNFKIACICVAVLSGCATDRVADSDAAPVPQNRLFAFQVQSENNGQAIVTRDSGFTGSGCNVGLKIDGSLSAAFGTSEQARFDVPAGTHVFALTAYGHGLCRNMADRSIETVISRSQVKRYRISSSGTEFSINPE